MCPVAALLPDPLAQHAPRRLRQPRQLAPGVVRLALAREGSRRVGNRPGRLLLKTEELGRGRRRGGRGGGDEDSEVDEKVAERRQDGSNLGVRRGRRSNNVHRHAEGAEGAEEVLLGAVDELALRVVAHVGDGDHRFNESAIHCR